MVSFSELTIPNFGKRFLQSVKCMYLNCPKCLSVGLDIQGHLRKQSNLGCSFLRSMEFESSCGFFEVIKSILLVALDVSPTDSFTKS